MNNELEGISKEAVVVSARWYPDKCLEVLKKSTTVTADALTEIRKENTSEY
jgi:hypothetical protein